MIRTLAISEADLAAVVRMALTEAYMRHPRAATHICRDGDFYVHLCVESSGWRLRVCDEHGGADYTSVWAITVPDAIDLARAALLRG